MENRVFLQGLRIAFTFCLYFLTLACFLAPILIAKYWGHRTHQATSPGRAIQNRQLGFRMISWCNCTATGIFLSMCFLGLLPYVNELFQNIFQRADMVVTFPVTECIVVTGFIITMLIEQSILAWQEKKESFSHDDVEQNQGLLEECEMQDFSDDPSNLQEDPELDEVRLTSTSNEPLPDNVSTHSEIGHHGHSHIAVLVNQSGGLSFFLLAFATGLHSIFEGITLGLQTNVTKAVHLFIAIIIHECLVAAALGINSARLNYTFTYYFKFSILYSAAIPLGLLIGILVEGAPGVGGEIVSASLQALSAGIFLHVTFQNFIPPEFANKQDRILKVVFITFGFLIFALLTFLLH